MEEDYNQRLGLFSSLLLKGVNEDLRDSLVSMKAFAPFFPHAVIAPDIALLDEWASDHYHHFGMNVTPNASMYLDRRAMLGGRHAGWVLDMYSKAGYEFPAAAEGPDHIGNELAFLAYLLKQSDADSKVLAGEFLDQHLLLWLPVFVCAVRQQQDPFYAKVVETLFADVLAAADGLPGDRTPQVPADDTDETLLLSDPDTHIRDIARYLLTPVRSGVLLSRDRIAHFGRSTRLPRGFGDRLQILNNLIHAAADYEMVGGILDLLEQELEDWRTFYMQLPQTAFMRPVADFWSGRVDISLQMVARMKLEAK